ncbi:MAG: hypothetical protein JXR34_13390 [Bacteroidales bacterium]|nr:hypothetical protein [Bacteroidales bacterium]
MNSKQYIQRVIQNLRNLFPSYTYKYQFDALDNSHVIEYSPYDLVNGDKDFENQIINIFNDYYTKGFDETLVIIDEFDPIGVTNPIIYPAKFCYEPDQNTPKLMGANSIPVNDSFNYECEECMFYLAA